MLRNPRAEPFPNGSYFCEGQKELLLVYFQFFLLQQMLPALGSPDSSTAWLVALKEFFNPPGFICPASLRYTWGSL